MHAIDIERELAARDTSGLEAAFRALVAGEDHVEGASLADAEALFPRVLYALAGNQRFMPGDVVSFIDGETDHDLKGSTYAAGVKAVRANKDRWHQFHADWYGAVEVEG